MQERTGMHRPVTSVPGSVSWRRRLVASGQRQSGPTVCFAFHHSEQSSELDKLSDRADNLSNPFLVNDLRAPRHRFGLYST